MKIQKKQEIEFFGTKTGNANSIALGYATETKNFGEVAVGVMNKSTAAKDPNSSKGVCVDPDATLFSVGCGGSGERKNALEVKGDGSVIIPGENGNINIADKIKQAFDTDASIELVKSAENSLQYTLMVNNEARGSINIPKDQFLKNVTYDPEGKQLVFTFVTLDEDEHVEKVPVGDLKDIYTAGEGITINGDNVISADFSSVMTAISDEKTQRETADNEIKSTLDTKADVSAIPTKVSQLTNDANFITSYTETDPVWTREKTDYYTKTEIDNKGYLTQHQPLDNYVTKSTADANYLSLANGGDIKNEVTISKTNATNDDYTLHLANEALYIGQDNGFYSIVSITPDNFAYRDFLFYVDENQFTFGNCFAVKRNDKNNGGKNTIRLGEVSITESSLYRLNLALDNITAASTAEEVVTKFNALLADLKNKGLMEADTTAE